MPFSWPVPATGAPGVLAPVYLEGVYSEIYPNKGEDEEGMREFFKEFSFPGGIGSHCTPETPAPFMKGENSAYSVLMLSDAHLTIPTCWWRWS